MLSFEPGELSRCNDKPGQTCEVFKTSQVWFLQHGLGHAFKTGKQIPSFKNVMFLT